jgi:hypothetical protein
MAFRGWQFKEIDTPRGMWSAVGEKRVGSPNRASLFQNGRINYNTGYASSRPGTSSTGYSSTGKVTSIHNWVAPSDVNYVLLQDGALVRAINQTASSEATIFTTPSNTRTTIFSDIDIWSYFCGYDISGNATTQAQITTGTTSLTAFAGPITLTAAAPTDAGAGYANIGQHFFGFVFQDVTGFSGVPTTMVGSSPIQITLLSDLQQINISVTLPALPNGGGNATLYLIATPANNPAAWYFIPTDAQNGSIGSLPVPANTVTTLNFVMNFSDYDLQASLDSALNNFLLLTQASDGSGPFNPAIVTAYGTRMCYAVGTSLYASDPSNPQSVTGDFNQVFLPNQRKIGAMFPLNGSTSLYVCGDRWTSYTTDNSDVPATWAEPTIVSPALGAPFQQCVCFNTAGYYAWITTEAGVYLFTGVYDALPVTHLINDFWQTVNWAAAYCIQMADDVVHQRLYVAVPTGSSTEPTNTIVIDYQNGLEFNQVDISIDMFSQSAFSAIGVVKEPNAVSNVWIGKSAAGTIAHFDTTTPNDEGSAVNSFWECGLLRARYEVQSSMMRFAGADFWVRGTGPPLATIFGPDRVISVPILISEASGVPVTALVASPGAYYVAQFDLSQVENATIRFGTNAIGASWELSGITPYFLPDLYNR